MSAVEDGTYLQGKELCGMLQAKGHKGVGSGLLISYLLVTSVIMDAMSVHFKFNGLSNETCNQCIYICYKCFWRGAEACSAQLWSFRGSKAAHLPAKSDIS